MRRPTFDEFSQPSRSVGRPRVNIPLDEFERLCQLHPTQAELAAYFGVANSVICARLKEASYRDAWNVGRARGKLSIRKNLWEEALGGNMTLLRYLAERHLFADGGKDANVSPASTRHGSSGSESQTGKYSAYVPTSEQKAAIDEQLDREY